MTNTTASNSEELLEIKLDLFYFYYPLKEKVRARKEDIQVREGVYLQLKYENITGLGECAPLHGVHEETLEDCLNYLHEVLEEPVLDLCLAEFNPDLPFWGLIQIDEDEDLFFPPTLVFAFEQALMNLLINIGKFSLNDFRINFAQEQTSGIATVTANKLLTIADLETRPINLHNNCIKIKMGTNTQFDLNSELAILKSFLNEYKHQHGVNPQIRLDPNGKLTLPELYTLRDQLKDCSIEYIEDPVADFNILKSLPLDFGLPIALDESIDEIITFEGELNIEEIPALIKTVIIKPTTLGLCKTLKLIHSCHKQQFNFTISSTFDTPLTLETSALLALMSKQIPSVHGIGTGNLFLDQNLGHSKMFNPDSLTLSLQLPYQQSVPDLSKLNHLNIFADE